MRLLIALFVALALAALARPAAAAPSDELTRARDAFRDARYQQAIPALAGLLYPQTQLADRDELAEAHLLLAVCSFETGDPQSATREFEESLFIDTNLTLDPLLFSDRVVRFFNERKRELDERRRSNERARQLAAERDAAYRAMANMVIVEKRDYYVNFIPFGAGQFQNGQRGKGIFFAVSEAVLGATSAGLFTYLITKYRLQNDVPQTEVNSVRRLQILQVATGGVTLGLMAWGIVDALIYYQPTKRLQPDKSLLPKNLRDMIDGDRPIEPDIHVDEHHSSLHLAPIPLPGGGGLSALWTF